MPARHRHLALAPLAVVLLVACDAAPRTDLTRIAHERPVAHATGPTAEPGGVLKLDWVAGAGRGVTRRM